MPSPVIPPEHVCRTAGAPPGHRARVAANLACVAAIAAGVATLDGCADGRAVLLRQIEARQRSSELRVAFLTAEAAAAYLMTLKPHDKLIEAENYEPKGIAARMGQMNFGKFKGCDGCHQDAPGRGGVSGPGLHSAWQRLQPAFISAYIANPTAWDPHSMMPGAELNADAVHKLADYLKVIGEKQP